MSCTVCSGGSTGLTLVASPQTINFGSSVGVSWNAYTGQYSSSIYYQINSGSSVKVTDSGNSAGSVTATPSLADTPFDTYKNTPVNISISRVFSGVTDSSVTSVPVHVLFTPTSAVYNIVVSTVAGTERSDITVSWNYPAGTYGVNSGYLIQLTKYSDKTITKQYNILSGGSDTSSIVISKNDCEPGVLYYVAIIPYYKVVLNLT
jgi:hypothetical protein